MGFDFEGFVGATSSSVSGNVAIDFVGDSNSSIIMSAVRKDNGLVRGMREH